jgi:hypothetical protein
MNRILRRAGLPPYRVWTAFTRILALYDGILTNRRSLCAEAIAAGFEPAWAYRTFRRVTGRGWSEIRETNHDALIDIVMQNGVATRRRKI